MAEWRPRRDRPRRAARPSGASRAPAAAPATGHAEAARRWLGGRAHRVAHALAHIELNAIDLAWDLIARFADRSLPRGFYDDWVGVAAEEAKHFALVAQRLAELGAAYGDLPAHDGPWEAAQVTAHDLMARLAVVPLVLEARGLDVTPAMIAWLERFGDAPSAAVLQVIYDDEMGHVATGMRWFRCLCDTRGAEPVATYQDLVRRHFRGALKPPFNHSGRDSAGLAETYYAPLSS